MVPPTVLVRAGQGRTMLSTVSSFRLAATVRASLSTTLLVRWVMTAVFRTRLEFRPRRTPIKFLDLLLVKVWLIRVKGTPTAVQVTFRRRVLRVQRLIRVILGLAQAI